ncbi:MAG: 3-hydroxyacyl-ACP dehydratase FabZ [Oscillospiraceae bacterium]|jgi:3-hydroxyacyl-[acyl-carrier-protein] dehydratase|nr:3-hydroxyacyl-ACP dehydratase FabZ [Oscillospiraceae bacterium]
MLSREEIMDIIPHRAPFLLLDQITELIPEKRAVAQWRLTGEEYFFQGHFPGNPVLPGVLIVEALAQTGAVVILSLPAFRGKVGYFAGIDKVRFRRKVVPGDLLTLSVEIEKVFHNIGYGVGTATVDGQLAATGKLTFAVG